LRSCGKTFVLENAGNSRLNAKRGWKINHGEAID